MPGDDNILPILDRQAPLLSRFREEDEGENISGQIADLIGKSVKSDDEEMLEETRVQIADGLRQTLAVNLGIEPDNVSDSYIEDLSEMLVNVSEEDILTNATLEQFGIGSGESSDDEDDSDNPADLFE